MKYVLGKGIAAHSVLMPNNDTDTRGTFSISNLKNKSTIGKPVKVRSIKQTSTIVFTSVKSLDDMVDKLYYLRALMLVQESIVELAGKNKRKERILK